MLATGTTFGRYRIERELGAGGMGSVYEAHDTLLRRSVALKVVRADDETAEAKLRLLREARAAAALRHPNAVAVFDVGEIDGVTYIAMELVVGKTLATYVQARALPLERKLGWLLEIARALGAAHRAGLVHRDVKPENVMVCDDGAIKVLDFGIAKRAGADGASLADAGPASFRTAEGVVTGTPRYMAPEQLAGATLDGRADQFAWGVVAYELLSGIHPQSTTGTAERWGAPPAALSKIAPSVPKEISEIVMRALERSAEHRWASLDDVVRGLEGFLGIASGAQAGPAASAEARPSADEPTMQLPANAPTAATAEAALDDQDATGPNSVSGVRARRAAISGASGPSVILLPRTLEARVVDPSRPTWRRLAFPALGVASMFVGLAIMVGAVFLAHAEQAPELARVFVRLGWLVVFVAPAFELARALRPATLEAKEGRLAITKARGMSQTLAAADVVGASLAPLPGASGGGFALAIAPKRVVAAPIALALPREEDALAVLAALGVGRASSGTLAWPLRRGAFGTFCLATSITWRVTITWTYLPSSVLVALGFVLTILAGLLSAGLAFAPRPGPHLELGPEQLRVFGPCARRRDGTSRDARDVVVSLRDLERATADDHELVFHLRTGEALAVAAPLPRFSRRALSKDERTHLVAHVNAAALRARAAYS